MSGSNDHKVDITHCSFSSDLVALSVKVLHRCIDDVVGVIFVIVCNGKSNSFVSNSRSISSLMWA